MLADPASTPSSAGSKAAAISSRHSLPRRASGFDVTRGRDVPKPRQIVDFDVQREGRSKQEHGREPASLPNEHFPKHSGAPHANFGARESMAERPDDRC